MVNTQSRDKRMRFFKLVKRDKYLLLMFLPILAYYVLFHYIPMSGVIISFKEFVPGHGIYYGEWVGFKWFSQFLRSAYAWRLIRNAVLISVYYILFGFPLPIIFAVSLSEIGHSSVKRTLQTVSYLPHFISTVILVGMLKNMFAMDNGIVNILIMKLGGEQINFFQDPGWFGTLYVGSSVWQGFGWSSIIYISAISGIDPTLYEAGEIDGISHFGKALHITLPMIIPTIVILFIMELGGIMSVGFEKVFLMYNTATYETADVIATYVYRKGIDDGQYSFSSSVGLFNSVINFIMVFTANSICKKTTGSSLW